jgi:hypothetical protein
LVTTYSTSPEVRAYFDLIGQQLELRRQAIEIMNTDPDAARELFAFASKCGEQAEGLRRVHDTIDVWCEGASCNDRNDHLHRATVPSRRTLMFAGVRSR